MLHLQGKRCAWLQGDASILDLRPVAAHQGQNPLDHGGFALLRSVPCHRMPRDAREISIQSVGPPSAASLMQQLSLTYQGEREHTSLCLGLLLLDGTLCSGRVVVSMRAAVGLRL